MSQTAPSIKLEPRLPMGRLLAYSLPAVPLAALTLPLYSFIPTFYAETLGVPLAGIGIALLLVRLFDAFNDPLLGILSDRFHPNFGRRKSLFALSIPILMLGVWNLFWPPADAGVWHLGLWSLVVSIGFTMSILPYSAWGAELQTGYAARSRVTSTREALTLVGTLFAISIPFTIGFSDASTFHGFAALALAIALALPIFGLIALIFVPEPREYSSTMVGMRDGISHVRGNREFLRLAISFFLNGFGNSIAATLFLLYCSARLGLTDLRGPFIFVYFLAGILGIPFWAYLAKRTSKHRAWCIAMICAIIVFSPAPFLPAGSIWGFGIICILSGLCLGADITLPPSIQADVIDIDTARSGEQRSGTYFALWSLTTKLSLALAVFVVFTLLDWYGFDAKNEGNSTAIGIAVLGFVYGWGPIVMKIPSLFLMWNFPLDETKVAELRKTIEQHQSTA